MSVRTTTVVGTGLAALAFIGVVTIFGESLSALVAPPPAADSASTVRATASTGAAQAPHPPTGTMGVNGATDGGLIRTSPDGSS